MSSEHDFSAGFWHDADTAPAFAGAAIVDACARVREPAFVIRHPETGAIGVAVGGRVGADPVALGRPGWPVWGRLPPLYPEWLGDRSFAQTHGVRFPYVTGAMANGIATTELVAEVGRAGFLGFFGAAGLAYGRVEQAVAQLSAELGDTAAWGCNLIHSPQEPALEDAVAQLYIERGVRRVSAAAFMALTPAIVRYAIAGIHQDQHGQIVRPRHVFAKVSRLEVARHFLEPAPEKILQVLRERGQITEHEAALARHVPIAEDISVESDSGGHTDNRPLAALLPSMLALRDEIVAARGYTRPIRVGAAGGIGTPSAVASAFALGAAYVLTGSVNQACVESGLDASGKQMLAEAGIADVIMAPAADMFELGVEVQVLRRGTLFGVRAKRLYELYRAHASWEQIPADERRKVEQQHLRASFDAAWESTRRFWAERDPAEIAKADADPRHKLALVFRSYLGQSSRWAIIGQEDRRTDFQIWCGPAMGAFNAWTAGSFLAAPEARTVVQVARNLIEGAAAISRAQQLRSYGVPVPAAGFDFRPRPLA
ncbi:PfaD family polyunsaturated fatty acid/polyketide biosynthesis protein [Enhygromyxa salina]|uniref:Polyketide biosynthesis protein PksE n=1 Tax=Enhygromyxa salina TaxID=215803 RepID=A0A2S9YWC8_9BACT|nr:PfaD family polyunsaturated fatty acid/polyketide biosynthesis protein [Enhygromyxa salina]PRQ09349.1 Polyketide biosynthesis protein PksE [Enhygromyxa salina]